MLPIISEFFASRFIKKQDNYKPKFLLFLFYDIKSFIYLRG
jgi:hypothetical protein